MDEVWEAERTREDELAIMEEEAHYHFTVLEFKLLCDQYGFESVMRDLLNS